MNSDEYTRMFEAEEAHWWYAGMREIGFSLLDAALAARNGGQRPRILDAGCGTGNNLLHLGRRGRAVGIELAEEALGYCRLRGVEVVRGNVESLPFADAAFDCVTSFDVLYHRGVADERGAIREMARVLRSGGLLLLRLPALEILRRAHDEVVHTRHRYTRGEVVRLLEDGGFQILRATYCNTFLLPLVAFRSAIDRISSTHTSDLSRLPAPVENVLRRCLDVEARLIRKVRLPIGASVVALAQKRG